MFKKALVAVAAIAASAGVAFANGGSFTPEAPHHVGTFYVGAGISRDRGHYEVRDEFLDPTTGALQSSFRFDMSGEGIDGTLFAGYGLTIMDHYYLGLEAFGDISSNEGKNEFFDGVNTNTFKVEQNWSAGIRLMPGVKITDSTMLYAAVGYINSEFKATADANALPSFGVATSEEKNLSGVQAGVGMEAMVTQNIGVRGEWDWNYYRHLDLGSQTIANVTTETIDIKHPIVDQFKFGVDYHFNMA